MSVWQPPIFYFLFFSHKKKYLLFYIFDIFIFFIPQFMCRHFIDADVTFNGICQFCLWNLTLQSDFSILSTT
jgi:hypothetical protein